MHTLSDSLRIYIFFHPGERNKKYSDTCGRGFELPYEPFRTAFIMRSLRYLPAPLLAVNKYHLMEITNNEDVSCQFSHLWHLEMLSLKFLAKK